MLYSLWSFLWHYGFCNINNICLFTWQVHLWCYLWLWYVTLGTSVDSIVLQSRGQCFALDGGVASTHFLSRLCHSEKGHSMLFAMCDPLSLSKSVLNCYYVRNYACGHRNRAPQGNSCLVAHAFKSFDTIFMNVLCTFWHPLCLCAPPYLLYWCGSVRPAAVQSLFITAVSVCLIWRVFRKRRACVHVISAASHLQ